MAVRTAGDVTVNVDRATAFSFVRDPAFLAPCIPGCRDVRELAPNRYQAVVTTRVAFITLSFKVVVEVTRIDAPGALEASVSGDSIGPAGRVAATGVLQLSEEGERSTSIHYEADIALTGKLGGLGEPVFRTASAQLAREFGDNLKTAIELQASGARA